VVSLASAGGAAKIYCVNGGGQSSKNAAAWLEAKLGKTRKRKGGQGGTGGEGEIRLIQVCATVLLILENHFSLIMIFPRI
jgi:ribosome biogenesis protein ENP2